MLYFDLLKDDIIIKILVINIEYIQNEITKIDNFLEDVEHYWYYSSCEENYDYDSDLDSIYGM
jgi:hypothetical protein